MSDRVHISSYLRIEALFGVVLLLSSLGGRASEPWNEAEATPANMRSAEPAGPQPPESHNLAPFRSIRSVPGAKIQLPVTLPANAAMTNATVLVLGTPKGARILDGGHEVITQEEDEIVDATGWDLAKLAVELATDGTGHFIVSVIAISATQNGGRVAAAESLSNLVLDVQAGPEAANERTRERTVVQNKVPEIGADGPRLGPARTQLSSSAVRSEGRPASLETNTDPSPGRKAGSESNVAAVQAPTQKVAPAKDEVGRLNSQASVSPAPKIASPESPLIQEAVSGTISEPNPTTLIDRAQRLVRLGDISGARLLLERAVARGDTRAAFHLAQTYDPQILRSWHVRGMLPDQERARELYAKAEQGENGPKILGEATR
jgi:hypothetical protein